MATCIIGKHLSFEDSPIGNLTSATIEAALKNTMQGVKTPQESAGIDLILAPEFFNELLRFDSQHGNIGILGPRMDTVGSYFSKQSAFTLQIPQILSSQPGKIRYLIIILPSCIDETDLKFCVERLNLTAKQGRTQVVFLLSPILTDFPSWLAQAQLATRAIEDVADSMRNINPEDPNPVAIHLIGIDTKTMHVERYYAAPGTEIAKNGRFLAPHLISHYFERVNRELRSIGVVTCLKNKNMFS